MTDPKTWPEHLDAARTPEEFGRVLTGLFTALDKARWAEENTDD